jgi:hypothetical protein
MDEEYDISRPLAPEEIRPGDYVAVLRIVCEVFTEDTFATFPLRSRAPVQIEVLPCGDLSPVQVVSVCLPWVLVEDAKGAHRTLDVRRVRLCRVGDRFGKKVFKKLKKGAPGPKNED